MQIHAFREEDLDELHGMICSTIERSYRGTYSPKAVELFKQYHSPGSIRADASLGYTIVPLQNGSIVGSGTLLGRSIRRVFVLPDLQGKGIGGGIMAELERQAAENMIEVVELDSSMISVDFYHHLRYHGDQHAFFILENGERMDYVPMTKKIVQ